MPTFIMLTRLNPDAVRSPRGLEQPERDAMKRVREECGCRMAEQQRSAGTMRLSRRAYGQ
jgi:hypothetical protein